MIIRGKLEHSLLWIVAKRRSELKQFIRLFPEMFPNQQYNLNV